MTPTTIGSRRRTWWQWPGYLAKRATLAEIRSYQSIYRFVLRRPRVPAGARGFRYHEPVLTILIVFIALSAVELVAVDLIVRRWPYVRIPLLVLSIWGLIWMLGFLFGMLTRPHAVGPEGIRVRYGAEVDIPVPWAAVDTVAVRRHRVEDRQPKVTVNDQGEATLHLRIANETNLRIELDRPTELKLPHGGETVNVIAYYADDPKGFLDEVRRYIG